MKAIQYERSIPKYLVNRLLGPWFPGLYTGPMSLVQMVDVPSPAFPTEAWARIRTRQVGICGSDIATICAKGSAYFSPLVSTPFILGHEVVGTVESTGTKVDRCSVGDRVVIEPALGCDVRGIAELCPRCTAGEYAHCENVTTGDIGPGIQTGYCHDTGGAWGEVFVAHNSQIFRVPPELDDEEAVLVEPFACALHAANSCLPPDSSTTVILGCGTIGTLVIAAIRALGSATRIIAVAKHPVQQEWAARLGADEIFASVKALYQSAESLLHAKLLQPDIGKPTGIGGADLTFDCVGSAATIDDALRFTRARGKVILVGMPAIPKGIDWTAIWYKGLSVRGSYAYGWEEYQGQRVRTFDLAIRLLRERKADIKGIVGARFPLDDYRKAIESAIHGGAGGVIKTVMFLD